MTDPLSDFLSVLQIESVLPVQMEARGRWGIRYPAYRHLKFGVLVEGRRWIWIEGGAPQRLEAGDFYLLTDGRSYCVASDPDAPLADGSAVFAGYSPSDGVLVYGAGDERSIAVAGRFTLSDDRMVKALSFLPPLIRISATDASGTPLSTLLSLMVGETRAARPGLELAASSLAKLILVHIIRGWLAAADRPANWLTATTDPHIGAALSALHGRAGQAWTLAELAQLAGMSRSLFARRFRDLVGMPPMTYLTRWRMTLAAAALRDGARDLSELAERIGYSSYPAFSIAFRREMGESPGRYRTAEQK